MADTYKVIQVVQENGQTVAKVNGETVRSFDNSKNPQSIINTDLQRLDAAAVKAKDYLSSNLTPPANAVSALYRQTSPGVSQAAWQKLVGKLQESAVDSFMDQEAKKYEKTFGVNTNAEQYAGREGYGDITETSDGTFQLNLLGKRPTFTSRTAAEKYFSRFNELPNEGSAKDYIKQQQQNEALYQAQPRPEQTDELAAEREAALASFRANQDLRDYEGGPMSPELKKKQLLTRASANTNTLSPELLRDQTFLRELKDMGVSTIIQGGINSNTQEPSFNVLRISEAGGTRDAQGNPLLTTNTQASGMDWNSLAGNPTLTDAVANVFWKRTNEVGGVTRDYDPSVAIGRVSSYSDLSNPNRLGKPSAADFAAITGVSMDQAQFALSPTRNETGATTDTRNWGAILSSDNPYQAALASKYELERQYGSAGRASLKVDPATNEISLTGSATKSYSGANLVGRAGNFAAVSLTNNQTGRAQTLVGYVNPRTNDFQQLNSPAQADKFKADLQRLGLGTEGLQDLAGQLGANGGVDLNRALSTIGDMAPAVPEGYGDSFLYDIPEPLDVALKDPTAVSDEEKERLYNSNFIQFKDINTGEEKTGIVPKRYASSGTQRQESLMGMGAIPEFDTSKYENLPSDPLDFKRVTGRDVTVEDFAQYGYDDPQAAYDNAMAKLQTGSPELDQQTRDLLEGRAIPSEPVQAQTPTPLYGSQPTATQPYYAQQTGTTAAPLQTAGLSAVPQYQQQAPQGQAGYSVQQLSMTTPGANTVNAAEQQVTYRNDLGQTVTVTEVQGRPITNVPPGFTRVTGAAQGGVMKNGYAEGGTATSEDTMLEAKYRIATMNGYNGPKTNASLNAFANASEGMKRKFNSIGTVMANKGGLMRSGFQEGGLNTQPFQTQLAEQTESLIGQTMQPVQAPIAQIQPSAPDFIPTTAGMVTAAAPIAEAATVGTVQQSQMPTMVAPATMQPVTAAPQVQAETAQLQAAQGVVAPEAQVQAAQQQQTSVSGMEAAQGTATMVNAPAAREIQAGEIISGVADAEKAALFNEQIQAATATPSKQATVQGQLEGLMQQFEGGETPAWAAGSMRTAMATLSARGLGASSLAGQAVIQATMEAALPIAQMDAQVQAQFEGQNLSNRQQRAMLAAQQRATFLGMEFDQDFQARVQNSARIGDIANINFTAEQNIAIENSRAANTMNLNNLSNRQAMVMAEAAALSQLDTQNLNNRQQAAVQNAQNFMQMDMTNLANEQQTAMFASQQNIQALFTDQAAENAAAQFNAANENQTNQFFANLTSQTSQFNASQQNAMDQFNVNSVNALREFNSEIQQQRDLFNAQNGLVIAQSNAQWRQNIATLNTAAQNESNSDFAKTINNMTTRNLDVYWQRERDLMDYAWRTMDNAQARSNALTIAEMQVQAEVDKTAGAATGGLVNKAFDFFLSRL